MGTPKGIFGKEASTNLQALPVETPRGIPLGIPLGWGVGDGVRAQIRLHMTVIASVPTEGAGSRAGILVGDLWGIIGGGHGEGGGGRDPCRFPGDPWGRRRRMGGTYMSFCINHCICMSTLLRKESH